MWCDKCGHVSKEYVEEQECPYWECPMENIVVDVGDELHEVLYAALTRTLGK